MGLMQIAGWPLGISAPQHAELAFPEEQRRFEDTQNVARALAIQNGAWASDWRLFLRDAEELIAFSRRWYRE